MGDMNQKKYEPAFIPCGDSFEKIDEIDAAAIEKISPRCGKESASNENTQTLAGEIKE